MIASGYAYGGFHWWAVVLLEDVGHPECSGKIVLLTPFVDEARDAAHDWTTKDGGRHLAVSAPARLSPSGAWIVEY